jgi:tryptophanyl-tRNA synthetase
VGRDQLQHVEIAADVAGTFNHLYGDAYKLKVPAAVIPSTGSGQVLPGLDGRKMSKSYGNTIPLLAPENQLKKLVRRMPTDSTPVEAPKDPDTSPAFQILEQFATGETATLVPNVRKRLETGGMGWGELKNVLFEVLNTELTPLRGRYAELMEPGSELDDILADGARRARERAGRVLGAVRAAVGVGA